MAIKIFQLKFLLRQYINFNNITLYTFKNKKINTMNTNSRIINIGILNVHYSRPRDKLRADQPSEGDTEYSARIFTTPPWPVATWWTHKSTRCRSSPPVKNHPQLYTLKYSHPSSTSIHLHPFRLYMYIL